MKKIIFAFFLLSLLACQVEKPRKVFEGDEAFRVTEPARLYFNNIRSIQYYKRRQAKTNIDIYTHRKFYKGRARPLIRPIIVHQWMKDEASIFLEKNDYPFFGDGYHLKWINRRDSTAGILKMERKTRQNQYEMAGSIYDCILKGYDLSIVNTKGENIAILNDRKDQSAFITTMKDYYKLSE